MVFFWITRALKIEDEGAIAALIISLLGLALHATFRVVDWAQRERDVDIRRGELDEFKKEKSSEERDLFIIRARRFLFEADNIRACGLDEPLELKRKRADVLAKVGECKYFNKLDDYTRCVIRDVINEMGQHTTRGSHVTSSLAVTLGDWNMAVRAKAGYAFDVLRKQLESMGEKGLPNAQPSPATGVDERIREWRSLIHEDFEKRCGKRSTKRT